MPTYEYRCPDGHDFEHFVQKMSQASAELPCPVCGKPAARQISAGAGLVFKGSGFYITDYGKDGKKDERDRAEKQHSEAAKIDAAKSESAKSEAKGEGAKGDAKSEGAKSEPKGEAAKGDAKGEGAKGSVKGDSAKAGVKGAPKADAKKSSAPTGSPKRGGKE